jgi:hypothetical protein
LKEVSFAVNIGVLRNQSTMRRKIHPSSRYELVRSTQKLQYIDKASANFKTQIFFFLGHCVHRLPPLFLYLPYFFSISEHDVRC